MTVGKFMRKVILPVFWILFLTWVGQYIFIVDGKIDWFRAMLVYGIPFGIPYMLFVIPIGGSVAGKSMVLLLNVVIGAVFGCVIAASVIVRAAGYLIWCLGIGVRRILS